MNGLSFQSLVVENTKQSKAKKIKILLVDDHRLMRESLCRILDEYDDIEVSGEAADGEEALQLARKIRPDIILMDINMPVMDGIEATRKVTKELSNVCVIGVSLNNEDAIIEEIKRQELRPISQNLRCLIC